MSISEASIHKCGSCGHNIARGRLTCSNCGAASPLGEGESICNYDYYLKCGESNAEGLRNTLYDLYRFATKVTNFYSGNEVIGEAKMNDFEQYHKRVTERKSRGGSWGRGIVMGLKPNIRLFMTHHKVDKDTSFDRFIAIEDAVLIICEVNSIARMYFQAVTDVTINLELLNRKREHLESRPARLRDLKIWVAASLEHKDAVAAKLLLVENRLAKWEKRSWLGKVLFSRPNIAKALNSHTAASEAYEEKQRMIEKELKYINSLEEEIAKLEETLGLRDE